MRQAISLLITLLLAGSLSAQDGKPPASWRHRFDSPAPDSTLGFVTMTPGWHVTTGPATILYDPAQTAKGEYRLRTTFYLFDPKERNEGYGIFLGGRDLDADNQSYFYFLVRRDGRFLVRHRAGKDVHEIVPWTENSAITQWKPGAKARADGHPPTVKNELAVDVGKKTIDFFVNGQKVKTLDRPS